MKEILKSRGGSGQGLHNSLVVDENLEIDSNNYYLQSSTSTLSSVDTAVSEINNSQNNVPNNNHSSSPIVSTNNRRNSSDIVNAMSTNPNATENSGVIPTNVVAIISIEPTLNEAKNYGIKDNYDTDVSTDGSEIIPSPKARTYVWPQVKTLSSNFSSCLLYIYIE